VTTTSGSGRPEREEPSPGEERGARAVPERRVWAVDDRAGEASEPSQGHGAKLGLHIGVVGRVPAVRLEPPGVTNENSGDCGVRDVRVEPTRESGGVETPRESGRRCQRCLDDAHGQAAGLEPVENAGAAGILGVTQQKLHGTCPRT
jgi:hypothetical protein